MNWLFLLLSALCVCSPLPAKTYPVSQPDGIPYQFEGVERTVAIGDIHGDASALLVVLNRAGLIRYTTANRLQFKWVGGRSHVVLMGDIVGRGLHSRACLDTIFRVRALAEKQGGAVHLLIGNHDARIIESPDEASRYLEPTDAMNYLGFLTEAAYSDRVSPETAAYFAAFADWNSPYAKELRTRNSIIKINEDLFVHAGLTEAFLGQRENFLESVNATIRRYVRGYQSYYSRRMGIALEYDNVADLRYQRTIDRQFHSQFLMNWHWAVDPSATGDSPFWSRRMAKHLLSRSVVDRLANEWSVKHFVLGHTRTKDNTPESHYGGQVRMIDTSLSSSLGGLIYAMEFRPGQDPKVLGPFPRLQRLHPLVEILGDRYMNAKALLNCRRVIAACSP